MLGINCTLPTMALFLGVWAAPASAVPPASADDLQEIALASIGRATTDAERYLRRVALWTGGKFGAAPMGNATPMGRGPDGQCYPYGTRPGYYETGVGTELVSRLAPGLISRL
jgi:hypothetical protein